MQKRIVSVVISVIMLLSLAACSGGNTSNSAASNTGTTSTTTDNAADSQTSDSAAAPSGEKIKLVAPQLGYNDDQIATANAKENGPEPMDRFYMSVRESITEKYPNYDVEYVDWGWAETLDQKQRSLIAAGDAPSIVAGEIFMPTYASEGILEPLPQDIVDMCDPSFMLFDNDGTAVGVAYKASLFMLFYNKELVRNAGLDPDNPPKTWDEFKANSEAITQAGGGVTWGGGIPSFPHAGGALRATPFFRQHGTDFSDGTSSNLSDPKLQETLQFIRDMNANLPPGLGNGADEAPMWDAFEKSKSVAYVINGAWEASGATRNNVDWGVAPLPLPEGGDVGNCLVGVVYMGVPKASKNIDASFDLIRAALDENNLKIWAEDTVCVPLKSIINDTSQYESNETLALAYQALKDGTYKGLATFPKNDSQIWEVINQKVLARTTITNDDIAKICADAEKEIQSMLN